MITTGVDSAEIGLGAGPGRIGMEDARLKGPGVEAASMAPERRIMQRCEQHTLRGSVVVLPVFSMFYYGKKKYSLVPNVNFC